MFILQAALIHTCCSKKVFWTRSVKSDEESLIDLLEANTTGVDDAWHVFSCRHVIVSKLITIVVELWFVIQTRPLSGSCTGVALMLPGISNFALLAPVVMSSICKDFSVGTSNICRNTVVSFDEWMDEWMNEWIVGKYTSLLPHEVKCPWLQQTLQQQLVCCKKFNHANFHHCKIFYSSWQSF